MMQYEGVGLHQELHQGLQLGGEVAGPGRRTDLFGRGRRQVEQMQRQQTQESRPGDPASILQTQFGHAKGILGVHAGLQTTRPRPSPWLEEEPILPWDMGEPTEMGATLPVSPPTAPTCSGSDTGKYRLGQKVEGRFRGKGRWYKGRIVGVNAGGTYDVRYDDGDEDLGLDASAIRSEEARDSGRGGGNIDRRDEERRGGTEAGRAPAYRLGDRAEARAPGTNRWQRVTVVGENRNGTLDVRFRDGTEERRLDPSMVRPLEEDDGERRGNGRDSVDSMEFAEGDRVEARFGGRSRWYKATVERKNRDGTYWLIYADGDEERAVDKSLMRRIGNGGELPRSGSRSPGRRVVSGVESETGSATGKNCRVGDAVEARYKRGRKWYPGVVRRVNRDGTMDITYKDGDSERDVDPSLVRSKGGVSVDSLASSSADTGFSRGDKVEARFGGRSRWFKATVERENRDGTYHLLYVDGDEERAVEKHLIRRIEGVGSSTADGRAASRSRSPADRRARDDVAGREEFAEGERVEARFGGRSRWSRATVERKNRNGTYRLVYADGNEEREAESRLIRALGSGGDNGGSGSSPRRPSSAVADRRGASNLDSGSDVGNARKTAIRANDRIEARFKGGQNWYAGIVVAANRDGSFDVKYDDGDREYDVDARLVRSLSTGSVRDASAARERGRGGGGRAEDAADGYARARHAGASTVSLDSVPADRDFAVGDKVEARFGGRSRWFKATIERENRDGTYHLLYVDGDEERAVEKHLIRRVGASTSPTAGNRSPGRRVVSGVDSETDSAAGKAFRVGDDVEARYKRGRKWYPGVVRRVNRDGTMDITYKDGDSERDVDPSLVRSKGGISVDSLASSSADTGFSRGDKVEARFGGRSRWFKATIERENRDGTYHLLYVDGDEERAVEKHLIRRVGASTSPTAGNRSPGRRVVSGVDSETDSAAGKAFRVGDDVEARYKRGRKWYPGVVRRVNRDGSMDITYKDGDSERDVDPTLVRSKGGISVDSLASSAFNASFSRGDKVEARFGGRSRWFKATIERENRDGTYHLLYVDGDEERAVEKHLIRRVGASTSPTAGNRSPGRRVVSGVDSETDSAAGKAFRVGDEVEARYKRGRKWYPGVVRRVNRDGTMDITYKDGDSERDVDPSLVRSKGAVSVDSLATSTNTSDTARGGGGRSNDFAVGDKVEARFGGRSRWFRAAVEGKNRDGTYCLLYDDGDVERSVDKKLIRSLARPSGETKRDEKYATEVSAAHRIGDEIEARYKRGRKWYPGKVRAVNANGSYDIRYLDGDSERDVEAAFVRPIGGSAAGESPGGLAVGDKVEARFRAGSRWFKATVEGKNRDGTFSLSYDDGDFETAVERDHIRKVEGDRAGGKTAESSGRGGARRGVSRAGSETGTDVDQGEERKVHDRGETRSLERRADLPRAGDDVEARLRGSSMWRLGRVARVHRDGSYDVEYGGGKSERNVPASHVRSLMKKDSRSGDSDSDRKSRYRDTTKRSQTVAIAEGDQVEARLRGGSTWHSGKVTRVHSDGTYDVRYSRDGELEKGIEPRLVRLPHYPDGTVRAGSPRTSNRGRSGGADTSSDEGSYRGTERGRRKERSPIPQETASEDAEAAATKVRRSLRHAGKTVDDLVRKLERLRRSTGGIDENTLGRVLARVGIEISTREARALRRCCPDVDNHGCVAPSALAGLVSGRNKSPIKRRRSSGSATRGGRRHASISELASDQSESESAIKGPASVARRGRVRGSSSSLDSRISSGSSGGGRLHRRHHHAKAKAAPERRSPTQRKKLDTGSGSELGGDTSSDGQGMGGALIGNKGSRALRKLGGSAFDGSLRQEFDKLNGSGRRRVLPISSLKPLLRHVRVKLEESSLAEVMVVVDPDGLGSFSLQGLLEVALSTFEDKKVSKVYSSVCEQLFKPTNGRGRKGRKESQEAEAASAAVSKTLSKLEHPKGSGLLTTGDLKKLVCLGTCQPLQLAKNSIDSCLRFS
ncbi:conserved unknown protein [Ectocarpus siliculosus]|uniref:Tudor domain-containing protein n=1 Tax=Ectocarpus siliculosus TaxID=2880 RepID=D7FUN9_ECTSI|nr:conserved unknown protein [Ectocarpus siliculosus]|eukprot:CBJ31683.1 conserved unknown protein [Ectocarpus siliculosus]